MLNEYKVKIKKLHILLLLLFCINGGVAKSQLIYPALYTDYDSSWTFNNLQLIPIRLSTDGIPLDYLPEDVIEFSKALQSGKISIKEIHYMNGSDVNLLVVKNHTKKAILVNSGEIIAGGKQDRVIGETKLIPPGSEESYLNVFCVEKGRWAKKEKSFKFAGNADMDLRKKIDVSARQAEVWKEVDRQFKERMIESESWSYNQLYPKATTSDSAYMNFFMNKMKHSDSSFAGFIAVAGKRIIGCELFASTNYTLKYYSQILTSFIHSIKRRDGEPSVDLAEIKSFSNKLFTNEDTQVKFLKGRGVAHKYKEKTFHIVVYGED